MTKTITGGYIVPTDARAEFKKTIQRANRRILSNVNYISENNVRDRYVQNMLAGDYSRKKNWATKSTPLSSSTRFKSEADFKAFMEYISRWSEDRGKRGDYAASPKTIIEGYKSHIYGTLNGLARNRSISLEKWGGDLPPEVKEKLESLSLEQITQFYDYVDPFLGEQDFDSEQVGEGSVEDYVDYIEGRLSALQKYFPHNPKPKPKKKRKKKRSTKRKKK